MYFRKIQKNDNAVIKEIVTKVMTEFRADPETTVLGDPSLNTMFENYQEDRAVYYVAELNGSVVGGCGIRKLEGADESICELQRMFLLPQARGKGIGKQVMDLCIADAKKFNYKTVYLESLAQMQDAIALYLRSGFGLITEPLGNTGHGGCNVFMKLEL
jgi:putative acetyltransferase